MKREKKKSPDLPAGARGLATPEERAKKPRLGGRKGPGPEFWLHVTEKGEELAFERQPPNPHLTIEIIEAEDGRVFEQTKVWDVKVRTGLDKVTYEPRPKGLGWELHGREDWANVWRRPVSRGWRPLSAVKSGPHRGNVWRRPVPRGGAS
jgi:hypothetical protein